MKTMEEITNRDETNGRFLKTHGLANTRLYCIWSGIKNRCYNKRKAEYPRYGGKGIVVCDEWRDNFMSFYRWSMNNGYSDDLTLDRIDNYGNYCPENCRWATHMEQTLNRSVTKYIELDGQKYTIPQLAKKYGIDKNKLYSRARRIGYNAEILNEKEEKKYTYKGGNYTLSELSKITGISMQTLLYRIKKGWNLEDIGKEVRKSEIIR